MTYVDGFVLPVPQAEMEEYRKNVDLAAVVWMEHGALSYVEAEADDVPDGQVTSFPLAVKKEAGDTIVFSYVTYKSREHRDEVMKKVMEDPRLQPGMQNMPTYMKRLIYGGFKVFMER
ncbi:DUF1428 domain-containing protein [Mesorhizobium sp. 1M-11]|uniref:DUF1428 domain-containing protein n=1 Tax=Mesorhizobium sp. 1M-11 TaxID=1529006 RepID=UPI0006C76194|nr:DUF1428 domain-containing protein [Mesorhizobium sp. 1M-11]